MDRLITSLTWLYTSQYYILLFSLCYSSKEGTKVQCQIVTLLLGNLCKELNIHLHFCIALTLMPFLLVLLKTWHILKIDTKYLDAFTKVLAIYQNKMNACTYNRKRKGFKVGAIDQKKRHQGTLNRPK